MMTSRLVMVAVVVLALSIVRVGAKRLRDPAYPVGRPGSPRHLAEHAHGGRAAGAPGGARDAGDADRRGIQRRGQAQNARQAAADDEEFVAPAAGGRGGGDGTGPPSHWGERGRPQRQSSLIVEPANGRMPPMTPDGEKRMADRARRSSTGAGPFNAPNDLDTYDRCISRGVLGGILPVVYNNGTEIVQAPGLRRDPLRDDPRGPGHPARRPRGGARRHPPVFGRCAWALGGRHAGGRDHQLQRRHRRDRQRPPAADERRAAHGGALHAHRAATRSSTAPPWTDPKTWTAPWTVDVPARARRRATASTSTRATRATTRCGTS